MPELTLVEKDELDVFRVEFDELRVDCDRDDAALLWAEKALVLTAVLDRGAASVCLYGSPALSARVLRLLGGSGTASCESTNPFTIL
jgi:hypothetical protein